MPKLTPDRAKPGQILTLRATGVRTDLGSSPQISFVPSLHIEQIKVIPRTIRQDGPGDWRVDITITFAQIRVRP